ncbi:amylopullulanase alpha-amylase/pullulanase [Paenibacillus sp. CFBP13512]|nr:amylopullulanase alpha-amylase/pullulanase [Paenibacillus sp. CFBP13512]
MPIKRVDRLCPPLVSWSSDRNQRRNIILKKILSMLMAVVLIVSSLPPGLGAKSANAATGSFFIFPNEQYDIGTPKIANSDKLTVTGSYSNINANSISYDVEQISKNGTAVTVIKSNKGLTGNINASTSGGSSLTISDIPLYAGLNRITFKATQGVASQVAESIYVEYRDGPTIYNLNATLDNDTVALKENSSVVLTAAKGGINDAQQTANMSLSGSAPNAAKVTVLVNGGNSRTSLVSSSNNYQFTVAPIALKLGKNILTIQAINGTQVLETTREVTFYNGLTTFYDTYAQSGSLTSADLSTFPDFTVSDNKFAVTGKIVVPLTNNTRPANFTDYISYTFSGTAIPSTVTSGQYTGTVTPTVIEDESTSAYVTLAYTIPQDNSRTFDYDKGINLSVLAKGDSSKGLGLTLRNSTAAYISKVNYLSGYTANTSDASAKAMIGTALDGANIFSLPTALEVLVVNGDANTTLSISKIVDSNGKAATASDASYTLIDSSPVSGSTVPTQRLLYKLTKLPISGTQTLTFKATKGGADTPEVSAKVNVLFGPYANFNKAYDGIVIQNSQNVAGAATRIIVDTLDNFSGKLQNVTNQSDIRYADDGTNKQTVFFYVNNTIIPLVPNPDPKETLNIHDTKFKIDPSALDKAYAALFSGENTIKIVFKTNQTSYENAIKINLVPTDVPVIPVDTTLGIFPFKNNTGSDAIPTAKDADFTMNGTAYTTKQKQFNIYGTFDFVDLGTTKAGVQSILDSDQSLTKDNYILKVQKSDGTTVGSWTLNTAFTSTTGDALKPSKNGKEADPALSVFYDYNKQSFSFIIRNQTVAEDGSPIVYNFTVYNTGTGGPSSSARMEISKQTDSYQIVRPLEAEKLTNSNFVDVVVNSKNATSVVINKETAVKAPFFTDPNSTTNPEYPDAYLVTVRDLKPNKDTKIPIIVTINGEQVKADITVKYVPTNIPGAEFMQDMKTSAKVFEGDLNLKFASGTNLIRRDIGTSADDKLKNEVFSGHSLLFGIGNSQDGVIDRYNFESIPTNMDAKFKVGQQIFVSQFNNHFVKSSPVYWIDPGLADDITTKDYDPTKLGQNPYQASNSKIPSFYERNPQNELVPSKRGTLTLSYSDNVAEDAGKAITVFFFDRSLGNSTGQWENLGGVVNAKSHTVTVPFDRFGYYVVAKLSYSYTDIVQHDYARDYMEALFAKGIMKAIDPDTSFGADQYITRGEFTRAIVKAKQMPFDYQGTKHFIDVSSSDSNIAENALYDYRYIETAARAGFVRGTQPQVFSPGDSISRQDAAVIIAKALNLKMDTDQTKIDAGLQKIFKDATSVDRYARAAVLAVAKKGFINGSAIDGDSKKGFNYSPTAKMLRSDTAVILAKVMINDKKLPKM